MTLNTLKPGEAGTITSIGGEGALRRRLLDMGLTPRTTIRVRKIAPMGDPMELSLRGYVLTLRLQDAALIDLVPLTTISSCGECSACSSRKKRGCRSKK